MTWQRIDENTYIDETLVTCAEYQLFIDEMREQGKYNQPDHWTSYQFPEGQPQEPAFGMRHSDAVAFCDWLTRRESSNWIYRLPVKEEQNGFPIKPIGVGPLGYWIGMDYQFAWVGSIPKNARDYDELIYVRAVNPADDFKCTLDLDRVRTRAIDRARDRTLDLELALDLALNLTRSRASYFSRNLYRASPFELSRALDFDRILASTRELDLDQTLGLVLNLGRDRALALKLVLNVYVDLYTLQERIAGRSPAFEGIRLVKERK